MQKTVLLFIFFFITTITKSQWYDPEKVNEKAANYYAQAITYAQSDKYTQAIKLINDALKIDARLVDGYLSLGGIYASIRNYDESVKQFEKAFILDHEYTKYYYLPYSISLAGTGNFEKAMEAVNKFLATAKLNERSVKAGEFRKKCYQFALDFAKQHPEKYVFDLKNLGENINSKDLEYFPSLTIDGKKMIFTRRINSNEDFYESDLVAGKWNPSKPLEGYVNSPRYNEGAQNISQDGKMLVFTGCNFPQGMGSCDLYISWLTRQGWSEPENMGMHVNSEFWESSPSLSPDKKDLYFSSNVPGGFGGKDIWVCHRNEKGKWSEPLNLGPDINTAADESCPFIHADNQTLYFNSNGHPGYSDKPDLFISKKLPGGRWTEAENLGYPINTIDDEGSLIVAADGKTAYFASDRNDTRGGLDIYTFELREDIRPLRTLWVKGKVYDKKTNIGLPSSVELADVVSRQVISKLQTDEDGNYLVTLPVGKDYAFNVNRKGYLFFSENFNLTGKTPDSTLEINIPLQPIEANANIVLKNVFFDSKRTALKSESITELDNVVRLLNDNPTVKIQIGGHTDNVGKPADNLKLSTGRAVAVVNYLLTKGVKNDRLTFKGFGETMPVADNKLEAGRALNRRTELVVISK